jgi:hypothetical protein
MFYKSEFSRKCITLATLTTDFLSLVHKIAPHRV